MITKEQKIKIVSDITEKIKKSKAILMVDFTGLGVEESNSLRQEMKKEGIEMKVLKKTLTQRALISSGINNVDVYSFPASVAMIFSPEEGAIISKKAFDFSKKNKEKFEILGGIISNNFVTPEYIVSLAKLPSREVLLSQLLSVLNSLPQGLVAVLNGNISKLVVALDQISKSK